MRLPEPIVLEKNLACHPCLSAPDLVVIPMHAAHPDYLHAPLRLCYFLQHLH
jgi:hypothetical protein